MWAVRYEHLDNVVRFRRWTTDISLTQVGTREWRLAVSLNHGLRPNYVGPEPAAPQPSSPRLVIGLLESRHWICRIGNVRLAAHPLTLNVGKGHQFERLLKDPQRLVPLFLVSCDRNSGVPKLDSVTLSRALAGTGVVYVCESPECDDELARFLPYVFRSGNGTVRIYAPGVNFAQEWTATRHRFFTSKEIDELGDEEVIAQIVRALTRSDAWRGLQASVSSIDDIEGRIRERRLSELRQSGTTSQKERDELLALFETENAALEAEKKKLAQMLESERERMERLGESSARMQYELDKARAAADHARTAASASQAAVEAVMALDKWPETVTDVAALAVKLSGGRLVMPADAARSLQRSEFADCDEAPSIIWRCLRAMADVLLELVLTDMPPMQVAEEFRNRTKFELTWTESKETKRDNRLMAKRRIVYSGSVLDITPHVKWGNVAPRLLRVHFSVDRDHRRIIIGHCGDHLDTYGTRRTKR
jgi:hypothetical protein